jgi:hypothetical protein
MTLIGGLPCGALPDAYAAWYFVGGRLQPSKARSR